jgi:hypothetical protein
LKGENYKPLKLSEYMSNLEQEIRTIQARNKKVEADKAWETSTSRKVSIAVLTYFLVVIFFYIADLPKPFINAIVPTLGFFLSTLSLGILKKLWLKHVYRNTLSDK